LAEDVKAVHDGGNPPASARSYSIKEDGVENSDPHYFANDGSSESLKIGFLDG
jgi:hypothetical protein